MIKNYNGDYNVYSYNPMPDGKVTTINLKILSNTHFSTVIGFASSQGRYNPCWVGCQIGTFGWHISRDRGRYVNNLKLPYGRPIFVGDVITIRLDLTTDAGTVTYFVNGQSQGAAFSGVRRWSPLYFGYISSYVNDAIEILGATVSDS